MNYSDQNIANTSQDGELTLKDLFLKIRHLIDYLVSKWVIILVVTFIGAGIGLVLSYLSKPKYVADLTFVLEDPKPSGVASYSGIASQLGLDLGNSPSGVFTAENIMGFLKSRLMIEKALLLPIKVDNKTISLADFYIDINNLRAMWAKKRPAIKDLSFPYDKSRSTFTRVQDSVLAEIFRQILKNDLTVDKADKKLSFIEVECKSPNEQFAQQFTEYLVQVATKFYVDTKTQRAKANVDKLQEKADSLELLLNRKTYKTAVAQDLNMNPARRAAMVNIELDNRDKMVLQTMYGEVLKNLEISKMQMDQETPIIQSIDRPILPLGIEKLGKTKGIIIGGILGGFLIVMFLSIRKIFKNIMNS